MPDASEPPLALRRLLRLQLALLAVVAAAFPVGAWAVFSAGADRGGVADVIACTYAFGLWAVFASPWLPLPSLRAVPRARRHEHAVIVWLWVTYLTHCSWELGWLVLHRAIASARDAAWAYPWWAYIDGGDARYAAAEPTLLVIEGLSVTNGVVGLLGLFLWYRRPDRRRAAILIFIGGAVVHLYSTTLYFGSELLAGLPNVDTDSVVALFIKFGLANSPWLVMPVLVLTWAAAKLETRSR